MGPRPRPRETLVSRRGVLLGALGVAGAVAVLAATIGYIASGRMGFETFPRVESDYAYVSASLPYGSPIERTGIERLSRSHSLLQSRRCSQSLQAGPHSG